MTRCGEVGASWRVWDTLPQPTVGGVVGERRCGVSDGGRPNILVVWGDDIGITNLSCYSQGLMGTGR